MKKNYTRRQIQEAINHWKKVLNEESYGGENGYSDPQYERPNKEEFLRGLKNEDELNELLVTIFAQIGLGDNKVEKILARMNEGTVYEFLYNFVDSMTDEEYDKTVKIQY